MRRVEKKESALSTLFLFLPLSPSLSLSVPSLSLQEEEEDIVESKLQELDDGTLSFTQALTHTNLDIDMLLHVYRDCDYCDQWS